MMMNNAEVGNPIPLANAVHMYFTTPSRNRVIVLAVSDVPTAQGQGMAIVKGDFDSYSWDCEFCLLSEGGPKYVRKHPTSHARGGDW